MTGRTIYHDHRRDRQEARRILAAYRFWWRDLPASGFRSELDLIDGDDRIVTPHLCGFTRRGT